jgi:leader peptidase (prepilin peptidase)/N-methyltransferase
VTFVLAKVIPWLIAGAAAIVSVVGAPGPIGVLGAGLALVMVAIAVVDLRSFIIPDALNAAGLALAVMHAAIRQPDTMVWSVTIALMRGAILAGLFFAVRQVYAHIRQRQGLGLGDVKLAAVAGAWLDWMMLPVVVELAVLVALSSYGMRQLVLGRSISLTTRVPFGASLAPSIWICWMLEAIWLGSF